MNATITIVDVFESTLGDTFSENNLNRLDLNCLVLSKLSHAVNCFYKHTMIPRKENGELRPFFRGAFSHEPELGFDYVSNKDHYSDTGKYVYKSRLESGLIRNIKKQLLFSHSICFFDPLQYLLDYFHDSPNSEHAVARLPAVKALLSDYSKIADLIRSGIVIPVSGSAMNLNELPELSKSERSGIVKNIPDIDPKIVSGIIDIILENQAWNNRFNNQVNQVLPDFKSVEIFREYLKSLQARFSSRDIFEPFQVSLMGQINSINPDAVSIADLIKIRRNDELFAEWRSLVSEALTNLYNHQEYFSDLDKEFINNFQSVANTWNGKLTQTKRKSTITQQLLESSGKICIGAVAGAAGGALVAGPSGSIIGSAIGGAIGGASQPVIEFARDVFNSISGQPTARSVRNHFLALEGEINSGGMGS